MGFKPKKRKWSNPGFKSKNTDALTLPGDISEKKLSVLSSKSKEEKHLIRNEQFSIKDLGLDLKKSQNRGAIYIGCLPFGFYDSKLKAYLQQFGEVTRMNVVRSKKTGNPLGYAFVEFRHENVAKIVAKTMNNYLMFKKLLKCDFISHDEIGKNMFAVNPNNTPELCRGTTRRDKNQSYLEQPRSQKFETKKKLKILNSLKKMQSLGLEIDANLVQIKKEDLDKIAKKEIEKRKRLAKKRKSEELSNVEVSENLEMDDVLSENLDTDDVSQENLDTDDVSSENETPESSTLKINSSPTGAKPVPKKLQKAKAAKLRKTSIEEASLSPDKIDVSTKRKLDKKIKTPRVSTSKRKVEQTLDLVDVSSTAKKETKTSRKSLTSPIKKTPKSSPELSANINSESTSTKKRTKATKQPLTSPIKKTPKSSPEVTANINSESTSTKKRTKQPLTSPTTKTLKNKKLTIDIEEVDEEIIIKTPPNVVKRVKAGKQTVICDATASTVLKSGKRPVLKPLDSITQNLFVSEKKMSPGQFVKLNHAMKRTLNEDISSLGNTKKTKLSENTKKQKINVEKGKKQKINVENTKKTKMSKNPKK